MSYDKVKIKGIFPVWRRKAPLEPEATAAKIVAADRSMDTLKFILNLHLLVTLCFW